MSLIPLSFSPRLALCFLFLAIFHAVASTPVSLPASTRKISDLEIVLVRKDGNGKYIETTSSNIRQGQITPDDQWEICIHIWCFSARNNAENADKFAYPGTPGKNLKELGLFIGSISFSSLAQREEIFEYMTSNTFYAGTTNNLEYLNSLFDYISKLQRDPSAKNVRVGIMRSKKDKTKKNLWETCYEAIKAKIK
ncbi:hypothetical protein GGU10DRAFT_60923 [Lentinula aff. detonsa]|uniref:Uncharacterized protein n=1 Tax=Lentinula aff. detonsa TaxID=2804958 RepID=A0AA38K8Y0_9AGAR|nr:hypothetical protein GGU10DRAFT_60923 [Lentinula aff. detonsa]